MEARDCAGQGGLTQRLRRVIAAYKADFERVDPLERYKWEGVGWYKAHWDIEAADFAAMLSSAFGKMQNLLASGMYYPYGVLTEFAGREPETVRALFRMLYDERLPLERRYADFRAAFDRYIERRRLEEPGREKALNHYQDVRAVITYLTCEYPEHYYFYKYNMFKTFCSRVGLAMARSSRGGPLGHAESYMRLCDRLLDEVKRDGELVAKHRARLDGGCYRDEELHLLTMDIVYYASAYMREDSAEAPAPGGARGEQGEERMREAERTATDIGLNTILCGPPGTGKTYRATALAVAVVEDRLLGGVLCEPYADVYARFCRYREEGRVEFVTFHPSYSYEDFIEGIRPSVSDAEDAQGQICYSVEPGVFKRFCEREETSGAQPLPLNENPSVWKVSLAGSGDNPTRAECMEGGHIRIGWDEYGPEIKEDAAHMRGRNPLNAFIQRMRVGDIVFSCYSESVIDAIGVVTGEYEWHDEYPHYKRLRKVDWIAKGIREDILGITGGVAMTLPTVYRLARVGLQDVYRILEKHRQGPRRRKNRAFIIDEINRGDIAKIFGELITLIEPAKRAGAPEEALAVLPYSQSRFSVPDDVYLIGTMNTADRSVAMLDAALRRRFDFMEMLPDPGVLAGVSVEDVRIAEMLERMNRRIETLYDREHTIGHAYFMPLIESPTIQTLSEIFSNRILPLLQEYFYGDYEKIRLVLGDNRKTAEEEQFVLAKTNDYRELFGDVNVELDESVRYEINAEAFDRIEAYRSI